MIQNFLTRLFGSRNERLVRQYTKKISSINALEPTISALTDDQLRAKTEEFKAKFAAGTSLDDLLVEAFAVCREGSKRALGMRHFDVQLVGGMVLHDGKIAEMRTGEGKTLTATLAVYLNALSGKGVHLVTVNDYLAQRDAQWMGRLYKFLGLTVGINLSQLPHNEKQAAYASDITYGTNNEYGFDYLRDNMVQEVGDRVQRGLNFAIVDEVDSILIDEARTPLIISGQADDHTETYQKVNAIPSMLKEMAAEPKANEPEPPGDYWVDRKAQQVYLSEAGHEHAENLLTDIGLLAEGASLYDPTNISLMHHVMVGLRAHVLYFRDQHYVVQEGEIIIVDEFTGRMMTGRRWSDGLHQAVEAKERVAINAENQTLASITFQNYFRMYRRLAGMTGTADTEAYEFQEIYRLETVVIPTHRAMIRDDRQDQVFQTTDEKHEAIIADVKRCHEKGQPVLVGTTSIENSELLSSLLTAQGLKHEVLNAKQHEREAQIVAEAGRPNAITIATNMAGRGTDIVLGGNIGKAVDAVESDETLSAEEQKAKVAGLKTDWQPIHDQVLQSGGLHIIGTERHESRRIDNQLRGRSGRQGDAGSSRFFLSFDDPLLKIFAGDKMRAIMTRLKIPRGEPIEAGMVTRSIETAQRKVEARNFDIRKQLLEFDDVANDQRKVVYSQRNDVLESKEVTEATTQLRQGLFEQIFRQYVPAGSIEEQWDLLGLEKLLREEWNLEVPLQDMAKSNTSLVDDDLLLAVKAAADKNIEEKVERVGTENWSGFERAVVLQSMDSHWREHLASLDHLRQGIHLRGFAQKNPKQEYKREAFLLFESMNDSVRSDVTKRFITVHIQTGEEARAAEEAAARPVDYSNIQYTHADIGDAAVSSEDAEAIALAAQNVPTRSAEQTAEANESGQAPFQRFGQKIGRNDPCPCGSGKKYKQCHGALS
jgi:preprotein translocase subunit SecA